METLTFVGVSTAQSAAMRLFPAWAHELGLGDVRLIGRDLPIHAERGRYREVVREIKDDERNRGALVTTHKIDLFEASRDLFDRVDEKARLTGETSCLSKREGLLWARATDPIASGKAMREFLPDDHWRQTGGEVLCLGAGGAAIAITLHFAELAAKSSGPARITVVDHNLARLEAIRAIHSAVPAIEFVYFQNDEPRVNDELVRKLPPASLVINATGMGKDTPGSPITNAGEFPVGARVWELNYRGELAFLHQALGQQAQRRLSVHDGWRYFLHGWATVIEEVFDLSITEEKLTRLAAVSESERPSRN